MPKRTAAEVLAEKLKALYGEIVPVAGWITPAEFIPRLAEKLAEDPAITVRTDMVVERFIVERHYAPIRGSRYPEHVHDLLTSDRYFRETDDHRIIVRPYPERNS